MRLLFCFVLFCFGAPLFCLLVVWTRNHKDLLLVVVCWLLLASGISRCLLSFVLCLASLPRYSINESFIHMHVLFVTDGQVRQERQAERERERERIRQSGTLPICLSLEQRKKDRESGTPPTRSLLNFWTVCPIRSASGMYV